MTEFDVNAMVEISRDEANLRFDMRDVPEMKRNTYESDLLTPIAVTLDLETGGLVMFKPDVGVEMITSLDHSAAGNRDGVIVDDINNHC